MEAIIEGTTPGGNNPRLLELRVKQQGWINLWIHKADDPKGCEIRVPADQLETALERLLVQHR